MCVYFCVQIVYFFGGYLMNGIMPGDYNFDGNDFVYIDTQLMYANNSLRKFTGVAIDRKTNEGHQLYVHNVFGNKLNTSISNQRVTCFGRDSVCFWVRTENDYFIFYDIFDKNNIMVISPKYPIYRINIKYHKAMYLAIDDSKAGETYYTQH